jgi:hypothetical protein
MEKIFMSDWFDFGTAIMGNTVFYDPNNPCTAYQYVKAGYRELDWIRICRIPLSLSFFENDGAFPGHYWIEIIHDDEDIIDKHIKVAREKYKTEAEIISLENVKSANGFRESYGWYPVDIPIEIIPDTKIPGTNFPAIEIKKAGTLNGDSMVRRKKDESEFRTHITPREAGRKTMNNNLSIYAFDPHQCSRFHKGEIKMMSHPYLLPNDNRTKEDIIKEIRDFANSFYDEYSKEWSWYNDSYREVNCHTFLFLLLGHVGLADPIIAEDKDKHFRKYFKDVENNLDDVEPNYYVLLKKLKENSEKIKENYEYVINC